jgi:carboxyl-terminal processing protease
LNRRPFFFVPRFLGGVALGALLLTTSVQAGRVRLSPFQDLLNVKKVLKLVQDQYVEADRAEREELLNGAIKGMLERLDDPYTRYMPPAGFDTMQTETSGQFGGLGILIGERNKRLTVISPIPKTPAFRAGIRSGDIIAKVEGNSTKGMTVNDAVKLLRGPKGSPVTISVARPGERRLIEYTLTRDIVKVSSVRSKMISSTLGYAHITSFIQTTGSDLEEAVAKMEKKYDLQGFILDLRNNPGGLLTASLEVARVFLDREDIVSIKGRRGGEIVYRAEGRRRPAYPLVVLLNQGSASASEIVAGAMKDNKRGVLLGTRSYGKGSVQTVMPLHGGSALALTTAYYYTPSGVCIHKKGIYPDIEVSLPRLSDKQLIEFRTQREKQLEEDEKIEFLEVSKYDTQLNRAVALLKSWDVLSQRVTKPTPAVLVEGTGEDGEGE